ALLASLGARRTGAAAARPPHSPASPGIPVHSGGSMAYRAQPPLRRRTGAGCPPAVIAMVGGHRSGPAHDHVVRPPWSDTEVSGRSVRGFQERTPAQTGAGAGRAPAGPARGPGPTSPPDPGRRGGGRGAGVG